jgi:hypothetical protein
MDIEDNNLLQQISESVYIQDRATKEILRIRVGKIIIALFLIGFGLLFGYLAFQTDDKPLIQTFLVELSSGVALFMAVPLILPLVFKYENLMIGISTLLIIICGFCAYSYSGVVESFFVEATVGIVLVITLDVFMSRIFKSLSVGEEKFKKSLDNAKQAITRAKDQLDYKNVLNDFLGMPRSYQFGGIASNSEVEDER